MSSHVRGYGASGSMNCSDHWPLLTTTPMPTTTVNNSFVVVSRKSIASPSSTERQSDYSMFVVLSILILVFSIVLLITSYRYRHSLLYYLQTDGPLSLAVFAGEHDDPQRPQRYAKPDALDSCCTI